MNIALLIILSIYIIVFFTVSLIIADPRSGYSTETKIHKIRRATLWPFFSFLALIRFWILMIVSFIFEIIYVLALLFGKEFSDRDKLLDSIQNFLNI